MTRSRLVVSGLKELRASLKSATGRYPRELTKALKRVGEPIIRSAQSSMPVRTGTLSRSLATSVRGASASIISKAPYGGGAEWGKFRKWEGWARAHGPAPRFVWPALEADDQLPQRLAEELRGVLTAYGWFH